MYTIEYYKTKKEKPSISIKDPKYLSENKRINYIIRRRYLHQTDLIEKCWNVKSLTIDLEDIEHIIQDRSLKHLLSLYARVKRANLDESIDSITILNNNDINLSYIYEIINCRWMVNANEELDDLTVLKTARRLLTLIDQYDKTTEQKTRRTIENEIELIKYYMGTIINKYNNERFNTKIIKLGNQFIRGKN